MGFAKATQLQGIMGGGQSGRGSGMLSLNLKVKYQWFTPAVIAAVDRAKGRGAAKAGLLIMRAARRSIKKKGFARKAPKNRTTAKGKPSKPWLKWQDEVKRRPRSLPGSPPHTHTGTLPHSIGFAYDQFAESVVVGANHEEAGTFASLHELGGRRFGNTYPPRPFMRPALQKVKSRLPAAWAGSVR